jgi:hypothetical protein
VRNPTVVVDDVDPSVQAQYVKLIRQVEIAGLRVLPETQKWV